MIRRLLQYLLSSEALVQKVEVRLETGPLRTRFQCDVHSTSTLAESYPIRRAAQLTAYMMHKGKEVGEQSIEKIQDSDILKKLQEDAKQSGQRLGNIKDTFTKEVKEGFNEIKEDMKKKR